MSDRRNRLIAGRIRDAERSSQRHSAKLALARAADDAMYDEDGEDHFESVPQVQKLAGPNGMR